MTILSVIAMALVLPLGKEKLSNRIYKICRYWSKILYFFLGIKHQEIFEAPHQFHQAHIFVGNHNSYMDIPPIVQLKHQPIKPLGKFESSKIPIFGWIYREAVIMVDRSNPEKRAESLRNLKKALLNKTSIFIFPVGTFSMTDQYPLKSFYNGAFKLAIELKVPIQPVLLVDTVERMHFNSVLTLTPGISRVVYLPAIQVEGYTMEQVDDLKQKVYDIMDEGLRRYRNYPVS
ncbi:MAG: lysophospholipid acyltransferase family protein [Sediminibacterium sp.]